jgi:hypothetical protein
MDSNNNTNKVIVINLSVLYWESPQGNCSRYKPIVTLATQWMGTQSSGINLRIKWEEPVRRNDVTLFAGSAIVSCCAVTCNNPIMQGSYLVKRGLEIL